MQKYQFKYPIKISQWFFYYHHTYFHHLIVSLRFAIQKNIVRRNVFGQIIFFKKLIIRIVGLVSFPRF